MKDKDTLFSALDELYGIMGELVKPADKELWKETVWNKNKGKSDEEFDAFIERTLAVARYKEEQ